MNSNTSAFIKCLLSLVEAMTIELLVLLFVIFNAVIAICSPVFRMQYLQLSCVHCIND